jgi:hypothetical protein
VVTDSESTGILPVLGHFVVAKKTRARAARIDPSMDPSQANSRDRSQRAIDAEIESLKESIRALKLRRNALSPVSSLPPEVFAAIFSILCLLPGKRGGKPDYHLARLRVSHVSHQWREIALNHRLLWNHVDLTSLNLASAAEILARAKSAPLNFEATLFDHRWDDVRFSTFRKELKARIPHIRQLRASARSVLLIDTLKEITSPAPTLEYLSLSSRGVYRGQKFIPDTLFNGSTPRLSCLKLCYFNISWKEPLLKGLKYLEVITPAKNARPELAVWLDALDEMQQLRTLTLHSASPIARSFPFDVERTTTLPSLTHLDILASPLDCALALAHLDLPALISLCLTVISSHLPPISDVQMLLAYFAPHFYGPHDTRPLQTIVIRQEDNRADILAWPVPDLDLELHDSLTTALPSTRMALSFRSKFSLSSYEYIDVLDTTLAGLPLDGLVTLVSYDRFSSYYGRQLSTKRFWLCLSQMWPSLRRVRLTYFSARGFLEMLLEDEGEHKRPLFPSLTELGIVNLSLDSLSSLPLCRTLMNRVEQGVPVKTLDLRMCESYGGCAEDLLRPFSEIVVDVLVPEKSREAREQMKSMWRTVARGPFVSSDDGDEDGEE